MEGGGGEGCGGCRGTHMTRDVHTVREREGRKKGREGRENRGSNDGAHAAERQWKGTTRGAKEEETRREVGREKRACIKRASCAEHAVCCGRRRVVCEVRGALLACDILLRLWGEAGGTIKNRTLCKCPGGSGSSNHCLSHFTCSA